MQPVPEALRPKRTGSGTAAPVEAAIPLRSRNSALTSLAGTMRRRGFHEAAILAALLVMNRDRCQAPLDEAGVRKIAHSVARYQPAENIGAAVEELTAKLALDGVGKRVDRVKICGRGTNAVAHIHLDDGDRIVLDPLGRVGTPAKLAQEVALQAGAEPEFKPVDVTRVNALLYLLGEHVAGVEVEDPTTTGSATCAARPSKRST
ncbi:primase C-terminal domain-containing protein [Capillimicrobium parvum]|uniref:primase C-terminal domain-containing protein n=1 Tax=Capillimicrobium parvum TaxID=2884022 RepID=UPI00216ACC27|nr:primase C-terminal domain-containing protein [Capillimicrobium parvum]